MISFLALVFFFAGFGLGEISRITVPGFPGRMKSSFSGCHFGSIIYITVQRLRVCFLKEGQKCLKQHR